MNEYKIALLSSDGVGPELVDSAREVLSAVERRSSGFHLEFKEYPFGKKVYDQLTKVSDSLHCWINELLAQSRTASAITETVSSVKGGPYIYSALDMLFNAMPIGRFPAIDQSRKPDP